jgi:hypothetical protein
MAFRRSTEQDRAFVSEGGRIAALGGFSIKGRWLDWQGEVVLGEGHGLVTGPDGPFADRQVVGAVTETTGVGNPLGLKGCMRE